MPPKLSRFQRIREDVQALFEDRFSPALAASRLHKFAHFCILVWKSFTRNRCPTRASALAYASLLALIPMLAVIVSVTSTFLKKEGEDQIDRFIVKMVASLTPPGNLSTNVVAAETNVTVTVTNQAGAGPVEDLSPGVAREVTRTTGTTNQVVLPSFAQTEDAVQARKAVARSIHDFIGKTRSGTLGVTGSVLLIFVAISMLSRIEDTFNDIWGVSRGRSWMRRIVYYWAVITLAPLLLIVALGLATGPHLEGTRKLLNAMPFIGSLLFQLLPVVVLCLTFSIIYLLMPNTKVYWSAALVGGLCAGILFHLNNLISVLYVSRVVSYSKIYGSLGLVPVFMIGLYFSWTIVLLGGQIAYAYQNRVTYLEERQVENVNQRGREFVALRLMTCIGLSFERGNTPPTIARMSEELAVPTRLIRQVLQTLAAARLVIETAGAESGYVPARPLATISCHDILQAMRATHGQELATRDEPTRNEVLGEFSRIQEAERQAAAAVSMLALVNRAHSQLRDNGGKALEGPCTTV